MCIAICYTLQDRIVITHFTDTRAKIPLVSQTNPVHFLSWGRRLEEPGNLPLGGCVSLEKKDKGIYDQFFPKPVKIQAHKFMEQTIEGQCQWFDIPRGQYLQGLLLRDKQEQRVYVATFIPEKPSIPFSRWPLIAASVGEKTTR
jgi:hypothetical protein